MDQGQIVLWKDAARALDKAARRGAEGTDHSSLIMRITRMTGRAPAMFDHRWDEATSRFVTQGRSWAPPPDRDAGPNANHADRAGDATALQVLRLSHAVASGDPWAVRPQDRAWLAAALARDTRLMRRVDAFARTLADLDSQAACTRRPLDPDASMPDHVDFVFPLVEPHGGGRRILRSTGAAPLRRVEGRDCPVVARLEANGGGKVVLRLVGGEPYRALCGPGSWDPVGVDEFLALAGSGSAWADNPFLPRRHRARALADLGDYAPPDGRMRGMGGREAGLRDALARAGDLVVIDGAVHRPAGTPRLHLSCGNEEPYREPAGNVRLNVRWSLGCGLASDDVQTTLPTPHPQGSRPRGLWLGRDDAFPDCLTFGLGDLAQVALLGGAMAAAWHDLTHRDTLMAPGSEGIWFDADAFPEDPSASLRAMASLPMHAGEGRQPEGKAASSAATAARRALADGLGSAEAVRLSREEDVHWEHMLDQNVNLTMVTCLLRALGDVVEDAHERTAAPDEVASARL